MKKLIGLLLMLACILPLAAGCASCGKTPPDVPKDSSEEATGDTGEPYYLDTLPRGVGDLDTFRIMTIQGNIPSEKAMEMAKAAGEAELARLKEGGAPSGFSQGIMVSRQKISMAGRADMAPIMKADVSKLPAYTGVAIAPNGYVIYRITKVVTPQKADKNLREMMGRQMTNVMAQQELGAYLEYLKEQADVEILVKNPEDEPAEAVPGNAG